MSLSQVHMKKAAILMIMKSAKNLHYYLIYWLHVYVIYLL